MNAQHVANFCALNVVALTSGEAFEFYRRLRVRLGQLSRGNVRTKAVKELNEDFEIWIHSMA